ncbi:mediator of RNA polymerase II transcription subunit 13 isoform X1 [Tanacetum coccineum]|uniref:Mediator of RNA polymerase II transcription subunit 13 n=1 Tax=Tanacetum coccineum TaxID=301880 RepID=A0ABQ5A804_9ASTR
MGPHTGPLANRDSWLRCRQVLAFSLTETSSLKRLEISNLFTKYVLHHDECLMESMNYPGEGVVTEANSGLSGGTPSLKRSASMNTDSYMRLPASPLSFNSNNISISGSSVIDGQSPPVQQQQQGLYQGASTATSLPNHGLMFHDNVSHVQKKPRFEIKQEDIMQQQAMRQMLQRQDLTNLQSPNVQLQQLYKQHQFLQSLPPAQRAQVLQSLSPAQRAQFVQLQQQLHSRQTIQQQMLQPATAANRSIDSERGVSPDSMKLLLDDGTSSDAGMGSQMDGSDDGFGSTHQKTPSSLHCCYGWTEDWRWLVCVWTDARGELLDSCTFPFGGISSRQDTKGLQFLFVQILQQGCQILQACSPDTSTARPRDFVITRIGSFFELECQEWQKALYSIGGSEVKKWSLQLRRSVPDGMPASSNGGPLQQQEMSIMQDRNHSKGSAYMKGGLGQPSGRKQQLLGGGGGGGHVAMDNSKGLLQWVQSITFVAVSVDHSLQLVYQADSSPGTTQGSGVMGQSCYVEGFTPVKSLGSASSEATPGCVFPPANSWNTYLWHLPYFSPCNSVTMSLLPSIREIVLIATPDGPITAYDPYTGSVIARFSGSRCPRNGITVISNNQYACSHVSDTGGVSGHILSISVPSGDLIRSVSAHGKPVSCMVMSCDESLVISGSDDGTIAVIPTLMLLDVSPDTEFGCSSSRRFPGHELSVTGLTTGMGVMISSSLDWTCKVWNILNRTHLQTVKFQGEILCLVLDPSETQLYAGGMDGTIYRKDLKVQTRKQVASGREAGAWGRKRDGAVVSMDMLNHGQTLLTVYENGQIHVWETVGGKMVTSFSEKIRGVSRVVVVRERGSFGTREIESDECGSDGSEAEVDKVVTVEAEMEEALKVVAEDRGRAISNLESAIEIHQKLMELMLKEAKAIVKFDESIKK